MSLVDSNCPNAAALAATCDWNVASTVKPRSATRAAGRGLPRGQGAGGADGQAADPGLLEVVRQAVGRVDEPVAGHRRRAGLAPVDGVHAAVLGVVVDE